MTRRRTKSADVRSKTATLLSRYLVPLSLRGIGFAPRQFRRSALPVYEAG